MDRLTCGAAFACSSYGLEMLLAAETLASCFDHVIQLSSRECLVCCVQIQVSTSGKRHIVRRTTANICILREMFEHTLKIASAWTTQNHG